MTDQPLSDAVFDGAVEWVPYGDLTPHPRNPRQGDVGAVHTSVEANGLYRPIYAQRGTGTIVAGHHLWRALAGRETVPVMWLDVDDDQATRILVADNRASELGTNDAHALADLLRDLATSERGLDGSLYDGDDLDALLFDIAHADDPLPDTGGGSGDGDDDTVPDEADVPVVTKPGDIWRLGPHRLICGDCRDLTTVDRVLAGASIHMAFTSPPYAEQREYDEASGFKPIAPDEYVEWWEPVQANVARHLAPAASFFVNIKPASRDLDTELYVFDLVLAMKRQWDWHYATEFCWKRNGMPKSVVRRFKNQFEPVYQFTRDDWSSKMHPERVQHETNDAIVPFGPGRGNTSWADPDSAVVSQGQRGDVFAGQRVRQPRELSAFQGNAQAGESNFLAGQREASGLAYPGNMLPTFAGSHTATGHGAAFPVGLPQWFVTVYSDPGETIFEPFAGSGSTILAAENEGRVCAAVELSPRYCDIICARWQRKTGVVPVLDRTGDSVSFAAVT